MHRQTLDRDHELVLADAAVCWNEMPVGAKRAPRLPLKYCTHDAGGY